VQRPGQILDEILELSRYLMRGHFRRRKRWRHSPALARISILHLVRESIEGEPMARKKKVVITASGDESKLAIVESDLNNPASVKFNCQSSAPSSQVGKRTKDENIEPVQVG
jgi:hypothetical protein